MEQAKVKIAISNIIADIDRRCFDLTHPVPDDVEYILKMLSTMEYILRRTRSIMELSLYDDGLAEYLQDIESEIKQIRINEYGEQNKEADRQR